MHKSQFHCNYNRLHCKAQKILANPHSQPVHSQNPLVRQEKARMSILSFTLGNATLGKIAGDVTRVARNVNQDERMLCREARIWRERGAVDGRRQGPGGYNSKP
ncbi:hypothetical protein AVEN_144656-1 [Araneus ventricosus]|uniref:Uncharacterized protein n=1 Tax=Araneus ventricosus TaxID=182803 RepID=A0A4Y2DZG2_ARAVE|nr:hypothetical protein AVEN_144656-1 [Araneus ventricosus]